MAPSGAIETSAPWLTPYFAPPLFSVSTSARSASASSAGLIVVVTTMSSSIAPTVSSSMSIT